MTLQDFRERQWESKRVKWVLEAILNLFVDSGIYWW